MRMFDFVSAARFDEIDRGVDQFTNHAFHISADIPHFGKSSRFDFDERRTDQLGQPPGNLSFADARGTDHDDVFWRDFAPIGFRKLPPTPPISQRNRHGTFRTILAHNVPV